MAAKQNFNFKSSGKSISRVKSELSKINKEEENLPLGFSLPLDINSSGNGLFKMNIDLNKLSLQIDWKTIFSFKMRNL